MANKLLLDEFLKALESSKSFQLLTPDEQTELMTQFLHASDEQLIKALGELKKDSIERHKLETDLKQKEEKQIKIAQEIKKTLKVVARKQIETNEKKEAENSAKAAEILLEKLIKNN